MLKYLACLLFPCSQKAPLFQLTLFRLLQKGKLFHTTEHLENGRETNKGTFLQKGQLFHNGRNGRAPSCLLRL